MTSYFDHFIVTQLINNYITDLLIILVSVITLYIIISKSVFVIPNRFQIIIEVVIEH